jgi:LPXTG-site transpeptidase (sortase) family protein
MNIRRVTLLAATLCLISGGAILALFGYHWHQNRKVSAASSSAVIIPLEAQLPEPAADTLTGKPTGIIVAAQSIDLAIEDGTYNPDTKEWTLSSRNAHYALPSVQPNNQGGNTLIYGHYNKEVFSRLRKLNPGDTAVIITDNNLRFTYTYLSTTTVDPSNVDIFAYEGEPRLTLQTCSGAFMQNRQFYFFSLTSVTQE